MGRKNKRRRTDTEQDLQAVRKELLKSGESIIGAHIAAGSCIRGNGIGCMTNSASVSVSVTMSGRARRIAARNVKNLSERR